MRGTYWGWTRRTARWPTDDPIHGSREEDGRPDIRCSCGTTPSQTEPGPPFVGDMVQASKCADPEHSDGAFCINTTGLPSCYEPFDAAESGKETREP